MRERRRLPFQAPVIDCETILLLVNPFAFGKPAFQGSSGTRACSVLGEIVEMRRSEVEPVQGTGITPISVLPPGVCVTSKATPRVNPD